jgi:hypothetical protein
LDGGTRLDTQVANILAGNFTQNFTQNFNPEETHSVLQIPDLDLTLSYKKNPIATVAIVIHPKFFSKACTMVVSIT